MTHEPCLICTDRRPENPDNDYCNSCVADIQARNRRNAKARRVVRVGRLFFDDHENRDLPTPAVVRKTARFVWINLNDPYVPELISDARYYADPSQFDPDVRHLCLAASRLLSALEG